MYKSNATGTNPNIPLTLYLNYYLTSLNACVLRVYLASMSKVFELNKYSILKIMFEL